MKKILGILIAIVIIGGAIGGFFFIKNINVVKEVKDINKSILEKMLDEKDIDYLVKNRFLTEKDLELLTRIKNDALSLDKESQDNLEKAQQDETDLDNILSNVKDSLDTSAKNKIVELNNSLAKLNPESEEDKNKKNEYSKEINKDIDNSSINSLIKKNQELEEYKKKIIILETEIKNNVQKKLIADIPSYLTREQIVKNGVQTINFNSEGYDTIGKPFTPRTCEISKKSYADSYKNRDIFHRDEFKGFSSIINKKIPEYQHKDFYMTYYNSKFNQNTTVTDKKNNKTYIVYNGSINNADCPGESGPGGAVLCIAYDYETKKIISVVGAQDAPRFILDNQAIAFDANFHTGKINYKIYS